MLDAPVQHTRPNKPYPGIPDLADSFPELELATSPTFAVPAWAMTRVCL